MSGIANTTIENLPYITAAAGAVGGEVLDLLAQRKSAVERRALGEEWGEGFGQDTNLSFRQKLGRTAASVIIVATGGALIGEAWASTAAPSSGKSAVIAVADRDGASLGAPANQITSGLRELDKRQDIDGSAYIARLGYQYPYDLKTAAETIPLGGSDMPIAVQQVIASRRVSQQQAQGGKEAIVVFTDSNSVGAASTVDQEIKSLPVKTEVDIVDVGSNTDPATEAGFQTIAKQTGGKYLKQPSQKAINGLISDLEPPKTNPENNKPWPMRGLETLLGAAAIGFYGWKRRRMPLTFRGSSNFKDKEN